MLFRSQAVTEGKIDFDALRLLLGDEVDDRIEKYQFTWNGKSKSIKLAQTPSTGTLISSKDEGKNWEETENLYIEGDNLEVLKLLQKTYYGKIKMIYIDPPYNTGGDFVYKDNFKDSIQNYKEQTMQINRSNPETSGRYHTDWLNMMYPRLMLAKNLLSDNGVIFISIDDCEVAQLRKICDEIFGDSNFIANLVWQKKFSRANDATYFSTMHDHILCFCKKNILDSENGWEIGLLPRLEDIPKGYSNPDNDSRGVWASVALQAKSGTENTRYEIVTPKGRKCLPPNGRFWSVSKVTYERLLTEKRIWFGKNGNGLPRQKTFLNEVQDGLRPNTILMHEQAGHNQEGKQETKSLFDDVGIFDSPKPLRLIKTLCSIANLDSSIVLDFFSGSSTTAHAVMQLNAEDGGNRKFIMVQLPELTDEKSEAYKAGYKNICEIGKERIRRAGEKVMQELIEKQRNAGLLDEDIINPEKLDTGFKVFKLESTNINPWDSTVMLDEQSIFSQMEVIKEGRAKQDVLYEVMLKYGVFDQKVVEINVNGKTVYSIGEGYLVVCLMDEISEDDVKEIGKLKPNNVIFLESGFRDDNVKMNAVYTLEKMGVSEVKGI